jgi:hypothetical protein
MFNRFVPEYPVYYISDNGTDDTHRDDVCAEHREATVGQKEALDKTVILRDMQKGTQDTVKMEKVVHEIQRRTGK